MIYLITNREKGICKIGFSNNPEKRLLQLQTGNPYKLTLECTIDGSIDLERELHEQFKSLSLVGEWFNFTKEIKEYFSITDSANYMVFIDSVGQFFDIKAAIDYKVLAKLCSITEWNTGEVRVSTSLRQKWCNELQTSNQNLSNSLSRLSKLKMIDGEKGTYIINPAIFWKGEAQKRDELLKTQSLQIKFEFTPRDKTNSKQKEKQWAKGSFNNI